MITIFPPVQLLSTRYFAKVLDISEEKVLQYIDFGIPCENGKIKALEGIYWVSCNKIEDSSFLLKMWNDYMLPYKEFLNCENENQQIFDVNVKNIIYTSTKIYDYVDIFLPNFHNYKNQKLLNKTENRINVKNELISIDNYIHYKIYPKLKENFIFENESKYLIKSVINKTDEKIFKLLLPIIEKFNYKFIYHFHDKNVSDYEGTCLDIAIYCKKELENNGYDISLVSGISLRNDRCSPHFWLNCNNHGFYPIDPSPAMFAKKFNYNNWKDYLYKFIGSMDSFRITSNIESNVFKHDKFPTFFNGIVGERYGYMNSNIYNLSGCLDWNLSECSYDFKAGLA